MANDVKDERTADLARANQLNAEVNAAMNQLKLTKYSMTQSEFDEATAIINQKIEEIDRLASKYL